MPHIIEPASSGRAKCRACKVSIEKGALRLGEEVPNAFGEGQATHWYHLECGARRRPEAFLAAWEALAESGANADGTLENLPSDSEVEQLIAVAEKAKTFPRLARFVKVHVAPTGRARCQGCHQLVEKGALRFVLERIEDGMVSSAGFVHIGCAHEYAGSVAGIEERTRPLSELSEPEWAEVTTALASQAALAERLPVEGDILADENIASDS